MLLLQASTTELFSARELQLIAPELILTVCACVALIIEVVLPYRLSKWVGYFALGALGLATAALYFLLWQMDGGRTLAIWEMNFGGLRTLEGVYGTIRLDGFALFFKFIFLVGAALTVAISLKYLDAEREQRGEFYALVLFAVVGMMFLASGYDLIVLFISLEMMALAFYVMVAFTKRERRSNEAAMKYFLLGAFSSGILVYGMSLVFGVAGSTNVGVISQEVSRVFAGGATEAAAGLRPLLLLGMITLAAGLFFKISAVPFHMWAPDAYEGAPTSVTAFLSTASKAASFALFARLFLDALGAMRVEWAPLLGVVAAVTILVGNWAAVTQTNAKRLLAYSSISNAGYLLLGIIAANAYGYIGLAVYLLVYTLMNIGAFGVIIAMRRRGFRGEEVEDMAGLGQRAPGLAAMMTLFMLSLGGLPATGGFIGKWFLIGGVMQRGEADGRNWYYWLALWAILNTVVSFYYYVRFIRVMYLGERAGEERALALTPALRTALVVAVVGVIAIGIYPHPFITLAQGVVATFSAAAGALALR